MITKACCKINIGLDVLRRREDGYHDICTLMYPVRELCDTIEIEASDTTVFTAEGIAVDCPAQDNLCIKALRAMQRHTGIPGARIHLDKRVPFGAGLGAGSSDAAAVLVALNTIYGLGMDEKNLEIMAAETGSDTAFFIGSRPRLCSSRGEVMTDFDIDLSGMHLLLVKPPFGVSTGQAYGKIVPAIPSTTLEELLSRDIESWRHSIKNDFETTVFAIYPQLRQIKRQLYDAGAVYAAMSGSGSTIFGLFATPPAIDFPDGMFTFYTRL